MNELDLINYSVLHIRCGDDHINKVVPDNLLNSVSFPFFTTSQINNLAALLPISIAASINF